MITVAMALANAEAMTTVKDDDGNGRQCVSALTMEWFATVTHSHPLFGFFARRGQVTCTRLRSGDNDGKSHNKNPWM